MKPIFWQFSCAAAAFIFVLSAASSVVLAQVNQSNPNVGDPFNPPANAVAWKVVNIDIGHEDGPFALPGKPNPNSYLVLDPASLSSFWSSNPLDLCPYTHLHVNVGAVFFSFPGLNHVDPAPFGSETESACGHGGIIYLDTNGEVIPPVLALLIGDIQGLSHISPLVGQSVTITGTVTFKAPTGVCVQGAPDGDDGTSDALFISTPFTDTLNLGDNVTVNGIVDEFRPGGPDSPNLTKTQVISAFITTDSIGNPLPNPIVIGQGGRIPPNQVIKTDDGNGDVESPNAIYSPTTDGIAFYESLEDMLVQLSNNIVVGPTDEDEGLWVVGDNGANAGPFTARGGLLQTNDDPNPERIQLSYKSFSGETPNLSVGMAITSTTGVMSYFNGNYEIQVTNQSAPITFTTVLTDTTFLTPTANQSTIATYNVDLDGDDPSAKFNAVANQIVNNLKSPTIALLQNFGDDSGAADDGIVVSSNTLTVLNSTITGNGGPSYNAALINPLNNQNGGQPGENPRNVILYNPLSVTVTTRPGGNAVTPITVVCDEGTPQLNPNPGLIAPTNSVWTNTPKPLVLEVQVNGETFYLINVDLISQEEDDPLFGRFQPPMLFSQSQRNAQAQVVNSFVQNILTCNPSANVVVAGSVNDDWFSPVTATLKGDELFDGKDLLPESDQYNAVVDGNSRLLDTIYLPIILKPSSLRAASVQATSIQQVEYDVVHTNAEFARNQRVSDRDPLVARLTVGAEPHDFAILKITAPKVVNLTKNNSEQTKRIIVQLQNQSLHNEIIPDKAALAALLTLSVEALPTAPTTCPDLTPVLDDSKLKYPIVLKPKKKLNVFFNVTFNADCIPDPAKSTKKNPGHEDYRYVATVDHSALDGQSDTDTVDDVCPHSVAPPYRPDPNPDGTLKDKGCGRKKADKTFGADVLTDVVDKR